MLWTILPIAVIAIFAVLVIRSYSKRMKQGCCGAGGDVEKTEKIKVRDKNKANYPHQAVLVVDGMVCGNCGQRVENALNVLEGTWAQADVSGKKVTVRRKQPIDEQLLRDTVNHIGPYTVMQVQAVS